MELDELQPALEQLKSAFTQKLDGALARVNELEEEQKQFILRSQRPGAGSGGAAGSGMSAGERKAFEGGVRALMRGDKQKADTLFAEAKAMQVGSDPDGGYMVHTMFSNGFTKVMAEMSPFYRLARKVTLDAGTDSFEEPIDKDTADAVWTGEQNSRAETKTPQLGMFRVELGEIYAMPKVTQKLVDLASFDVVGWLQTKVGEAFGTKESAAFHLGDGAGNKPRGLLTAPTSTAGDATRPWGTLQYFPSGGSGAFAAGSQDTLIDLTTALKPQYRAGARWFMNRKTAAVIRKWKNGDEMWLWNDSLQLGQPATLLGFPVELDEDMPDMAAGSLSIAFGNLERAYTIIEKPGIKFLPDPYTAKPHVLLYSYRRVGGNMNNSEAIKLMKFSAT